jgi:putative methanogenesis marker protein 5
MNILIFPYDSPILYDLVARCGHTPLGITEARAELDVDAGPPYGITHLHPTIGLQNCPVEVPAGVRGRIAILAPLLEKADACVFLDGVYGFLESGCERTNLYMNYLIHEKGLPTFHLKIPANRDGIREMMEKMKCFFEELTIVQGIEVR